LSNFFSAGYFFFFFSFGVIHYYADAIHAADGKEYILEVNDTAIGLGPEDEQEDNGYIRDLVIEKLRSLS
jgi:hypothetical protein